ncbi:MAG: hypothetical protein HC875_06835 [Anaerolineales bacterium]|nr:hypothetical protein [Anaerolineales bacterium]
MAVTSPAPTFENRLTTPIDQKPNLSPSCLLALVAAFTERLTERERCTGKIDFARIEPLQ